MELSVKLSSTFHMANPPSDEDASCLKVPTAALAERPIAKNKHRKAREVQLHK